MAKSNNRRNRPAAHGLQPAQAIPDAILGSAQRLTARTEGRVTVDLPPNSYREIQAAAVASSVVRIATIRAAKPAFSPEQHQKYLAIADLYGRTAAIPAHRFDIPSESMKQVTVLTQPVDKDGYVVYVPARSIHHTSNVGVTNAKAFTHVGVDWNEEKVVSFVTSDRDEVHSERAFMTATEIAQNRLAVTGVQLETGAVHKSHLAYEPYQESIANGLGNMLGSVAIGSNYLQYTSYIQGIYKHTPMFGNNLPRTLFSKGIHLVAPHIMFSEQAYEQIADGEIPTTIPELIPVMPVAISRR